MNKRPVKILWLISALLFFQSRLFSQVVKAGVDRNKIYIGEAIQVRLTIESARPGTPWFHFPDSVNHLEVTKRSKIDTVANGGLINLSQTISITSFDSGHWEFPSLLIAGINQPTPSFGIDVLPVDVSKMKDYNDIKEIEEVDINNNPYVIASIVLLTLAALAGMYYAATRRRTSQTVRQPLSGKNSPLDWALAELAKLQPSEVRSPAEVKKLYSDLVAVSRAFFTLQLQQQPGHQTTEEWMLTLSPLPVDQPVKTSFFQMLRLADTVKFAKFIPATSDNVEAVDYARQMLQKAALVSSPLHAPYQPK